MRCLSYYQTVVSLICILFINGATCIAAPSSSNPVLVNPAVSNVQKQALTIPLTKAQTQVVITYLSPKTCVQKGDKVTLTGSSFGSSRNRSLAIIDSNLHIDMEVSKWSDKTIIALIPRDNRLIAGNQYQVGVEDSSHKKWLATKQYIRLCASTNQTVPPSANQITSAYTRITPVINNQQNNNVDTSQADINENYGDQEYYEAKPDKLDYTRRTGSLLDSGQLPPPPETLQLRSTDNDLKTHEPNELIIVSINMNDAVTMQQELSAYGIRVKRRQKLNNIGLVISTLAVPGNVQVSQILPEIQQEYPNLWVTLNTRYQLQSAENRATIMKMVGWNKTISACGSKMRIGLIDTLIDTSHAAFSGQNVQQKSIISRGVQPADSDHGTAIAGLLVGNSEPPENSGLLPAATLIAANVFRKDENSANTTAEILIRALDWLIEQDVDAINMSLGGPENAILSLAIESTLSKGISIISSAGNGGSDSAPPYPAAQAGVIAVTAIDSRNQLFSNATTGEHVDFAAPGVDLWVSLSSQKSGYRTGTSYATPFVTAALLIAKQRSPDKNTLEVLQENVVDLGEKGKDKQFGWGLIKLLDACAVQL